MMEPIRKEEARVCLRGGTGKAWAASSQAASAIIMIIDYRVSLLNYPDSPFTTACGHLKEAKTEICLGDMYPSDLYPSSMPHPPYSTFRIALSVPYSSFSYKISVIMLFPLPDKLPFPSNHQPSLPILPNSREDMLQLKLRLKGLLQVFQLFKDEALSSTRQDMAKITTMLSRCMHERFLLENQLDKSRQVQNTMRSEVIQLKDLINEAMIDYNKDLQGKNQEIQRLSEELKKYDLSRQTSRELSAKEESNESSRVEELEIIQEESEQATYSSVTSMREFWEEDRDSRQRAGSVSIIPESHFEETQQIPLPNCIQQTNHSEHKRTKTFIDNFRKTIEQSTRAQEEQEGQVNPKVEQSTSLKLRMRSQKENQIGVCVPEQEGQPSRPNQPSQPLREIGNCNQPVRYYTNLLKFKEKQPDRQQQFNLAKTTYLQTESEESRNESFIDELSKVSGIEQESQINPIKKFETPSSLFSKKKSTHTHQRFKTEPSPEPTSSNSYSNNNYHNYSSQKAEPRRQSRKPREHSFSDSKSMRSGSSKQKIKVTSRMVEEGYQPKRNHHSNHVKAVVYLGGKSLFRKFLLELKQAFRRYEVKLNCDELKYEGETRGRQKWGRGKVLFRSGMVYEGEFRENMRCGRGCLSLNGISIYEGEWVGNQLHGEGYLKSMRLMTESCPELFQEASYCGNLQDGRLHGIGTIFLNPRQKIVTKFSGGCPVGELTYYNLQEIEFGVWPCE